MLGCIGVVSPGSMGSAVGRSLAAAGSHVVVALEGRSPHSVERARRAGLEDVGRLEALVERSDIVLSIVPPACAVVVATDVAAAMTRTGARSRVLDANAISPGRAREVASVVERSGGHYVDGAIVGGPPHPGGRTDLFVSGPEATWLAAELVTPELAVTALGPDPAAASALKMCFAAWTKGTSALLIAIRAVAQHSGVDEALCSLWERGDADLVVRSDGAGAVAGRAWRWVDEMTEIARTFEAAGLPGGAAASAADLYARLSSFKDIERTPALGELIAAVTP